LGGVDAVQLERIAAIIGGMLLLLAGWMLYRVGLRVLGGLLGLLIALLLVCLVLQSPFARQDARVESIRVYVYLGAAVIGALVGALAVMNVYYVLVAIAFGLMGLIWQQGSWFQSWARELHSPSWERLLTGAGGAVLCAAGFALLGVLFHRHLVILLTSMSGSVLILSHLPERYQYHFIVPSLTVLGILFQLGVIRHRRVESRSMSRAEARTSRRKE
jgi:hypothetical protein